MLGIFFGIIVTTTLRPAMWVKYTACMHDRRICWTRSAVIQSEDWYVCPFGQHERHFCTEVKGWVTVWVSSKGHGNGGWERWTDIIDYACTAVSDELHRYWHVIWLNWEQNGRIRLRLANCGYSKWIWPCVLYWAKRRMNGCGVHDEYLTWRTR